MDGGDVVGTTEEYRVGGGWKVAGVGVGCDGAALWGGGGCCVVAAGG